MKDKKLSKKIYKKYLSEKRQKVRYTNLERLKRDISRNKLFYFPGRKPGVLYYLLVVGIMVLFSTLLSVFVSRSNMDSSGKFMTLFMSLFFGNSFGLMALFFAAVFSTSTLFVFGPEGILTQSLTKPQEALSWDNVERIEYDSIGLSSTFPSFKKEENFQVIIDLKNGESVYLDTKRLSASSYPILNERNLLDTNADKEIIPKLLLYYYQIRFVKEPEKGMVVDPKEVEIRGLIETLIDYRELAISKIEQILKLPKEYVMNVLVSESLVINSIYTVKNDKIVIKKHATVSEIEDRIPKLLESLAENR